MDAVVAIQIPNGTRMAVPTRAITANSLLSAQDTICGFLFPTIASRLHHGVVMCNGSPRLWITDSFCAVILIGAALHFPSTRGVETYDRIK